MRARLDKNCLRLFCTSIFQLALQVSATVLIFAEFVKLALVVLEGDIVKACFVSAVQATSRTPSLQVVFAVLSIRAILTKIALTLILISLQLTIQSHLSGHLVHIIRMHAVGIHLRTVVEYH
jgi:hypothetical protein